MPLDREPRVLGRHPAAVVADEQALDAAAVDLDLDPRGAGVERVLDELLDDRGRPLDDLAGGDPVDHLSGEAANSAACAASLT